MEGKPYTRPNLEPAAAKQAYTAVTKKIKQASSDPYKICDNLMEDFLHEKS